jgi:hypothetical protein
MDWLYSWSTLNAVMAPIAVGALLYAQRRRNTPHIYGMLFWFIHAMLFWWFVEWRQLTGQYGGPSQFVSSWGAIVYLQAFVTVIGMAVVEYGLRAGQTKPE